MPKLTKDLVESIESGERDRFVWDSQLSGFGLRVKPSGVKSFVIQFRNAQGKSRRETLGQFANPLTVDEARKAARGKLAMVTLGADPVAEKDEARRAWTFADLCHDYLAQIDGGNHLTRRGVPKAASTVATDKGRIERHLVPLLGKRLVRDLKRADVQTAFASIKTGKTRTDVKTAALRGRAIVTGGKGTAKRTVGLLSAILGYAVEAGLIENNPAQGVRLPKDGKRTIGDPVATYASLGRALALANEAAEPWQAVEALRLLALTGMRRHEAVALKWSEVDFAGRALLLATSKTGESVRPLGRRAAQLLDAIRSRAADPTFVFPSIRGTDTHYGGLPRAFARIISAKGLDAEDRATLSDFTPHRLRHAAATTADALGFTLPTIGALLGHASGGVTAGYVSRIDSVLVGAADCLTDRIAGDMGDSNIADIIEISTRRIVG